VCPADPHCDSGRVDAYSLLENWIELDGEIEPIERKAGAWFGCSLTVASDRVLVGSYRQDFGAHNAGAAMSFVRDATGTRRQDATLIVPAAQVDDHAGTGVALAGDRALVGVPDRDVAGADAGSVLSFALPKPLSLSASRAGNLLVATMRNGRPNGACLVVIDGVGGFPFGPVSIGSGLFDARGRFTLSLAVPSLPLPLTVRLRGYGQDRVGGIAVPDPVTVFL
jgi:hypothetical protein